VCAVSEGRTFSDRVLCYSALLAAALIGMRLMR
jgi:hypothetical protein